MSDYATGREILRELLTIRYLMAGNLLFLVLFFAWTVDALRKRKP